MVTTNRIEVNGRPKVITIDQGNTVTLLQYKQRKNNRYQLKNVNKFEKTYRICTILTFNDRKIAQCIDKNGEYDLFSINQCDKIVSGISEEKIEFFYVAGEVFVKVANETKQQIFDEVGNLIVSEIDYDIIPKFSGCNVVIEKRHKVSKKVYYYNLEGCPC